MLLSCIILYKLDLPYSRHTVPLANYIIFKHSFCNSSVSSLRSGSPHDALHLTSFTMINTKVYGNIMRVREPLDSTSPRACAARVTVVVCPSARPCVCLSTFILKLRATRRPKSDTNGFRCHTDLIFKMAIFVKVLRSKVMV